MVRVAIFFLRRHFISEALYRNLKGLPLRILSQMDKHTVVMVRISSCQSSKGTRLKSGSKHLALSLDLDPKDAACGVYVQTKLHRTGRGEDIALASMGVARINHGHENCICPCPSSQSNVHNLCSSKVRYLYNRKRFRMSHCQPHAPGFTHPRSKVHPSLLYRPYDQQMTID